MVDELIFEELTNTRLDMTAALDVDVDIVGDNLGHRLRLLFLILRRLARLGLQELVVLVDGIILGVAHRKLLL